MTKIQQHSLDDDVNIEDMKVKKLPKIKRQSFLDEIVTRINWRYREINPIVKCPNYGGTNVQVLAWVYPNKHYSLADTVTGDKADLFCKDCYEKFMNSTQ